MDANPNRTERLNELLRIAMDGEISDEHLAEIEQLMADDELRTYAAETMQFHGLLQWHGGDLAAFTETADSQPRPEKLSLQNPSPKTRKRTWLLAALAASLLFAIGLNIILQGINRPEILTVAHEMSPESPEGRPWPKRNGRYIGVVNQRSANATAPGGLPEIGGFVTDETIELSSGSMTINLFDGADLKMLGPCRVAFDTNHEVVSCLSGRVQLDIYDPTSRLRLKTPSGEVLHIGTSFGVAVEEKSGETAIEVFDGEVEFVANGKATAPASSRVFIPGSLVHLAANGALSISNQVMNWETIEEESRYRTPPIPVLTTEGAACIVAVEPGPRAPDGWHIEDHHVSIPTLDTAESVFSRHLEAGDVARVSDIDAIDFQDGYGEPEYRETVRGYINLFDRDRPAPGLPNRPEGTNCFVAKYSGKFKVEESWRYSFVVNADDGYRLTIDGRDVIVDPNVRACQTSIVTIPLDQGEHEFELLVFDEYGFHRIELGVAVGRERQLEKFQILRRPDSPSTQTLDSKKIVGQF